MKDVLNVYEVNKWSLGNFKDIEYLEEFNGQKGPFFGASLPVFVGKFNENTLAINLSASITPTHNTIDTIFDLWGPISFYEEDLKNPGTGFSAFCRAVYYGEEWKKEEKRYSEWKEKHWGDWNKPKTPSMDAEKRLQEATEAAATKRFIAQAFFRKLKEENPDIFEKIKNVLELSLTPEDLLSIRNTENEVKTLEDKIKNLENQILECQNEITNKKEHKKRIQERSEVAVMISCLTT